MLAEIFSRFSFSSSRRQRRQYTREDIRSYGGSSVRFRTITDPAFKPGTITDGESLLTISVLLTYHQNVGMDHWFFHV